MAKIGSLTVDLTLKSANFIRDLGKSSQAVARNTSAMQRSVSNLTTGFGALFSARLIRQISSVTTESLKLAASMHGPLADAAQKSLTQFEGLQDTFKLGLAKGFLEETHQGLIDTAANTKKAGEAGTIFGTILGAIAKDAGQFVGTDVPGFLEDVRQKYAGATQAANDFRDSLHNITSVAKTTPGIQPEEVDIVLAYGTATELAAMAQQSFWSATVETTVAGEQLLAQNAAYIEFIDRAGTPLEQYRLALARINEEQLSGAEAARLEMQAQIELGDKVLTIAGNITTALSTAFKDNKAFAVADTVINTAQAVMKTYAQFGGGPWGIAAAASVAAVGAAQIATILSAQPGTSKKPSATSGGASTAAAGSAGGGNGRSGPSQVVQINLRGEGGFSRDQVRGLRDQLVDLSRDGGGLSFA